MKERSRQRWVAIAFVTVVVGAFGATAWYYFSQCDTFDCPNVVTFIRDFGPWAPLAYAAAYVISSPVPFLNCPYPPRYGTRVTCNRRLPTAWSTADATQNPREPHLFSQS